MNNYQVLATKKFHKEISKYLTVDELSELCTFLANNPDTGSIIQGTGGIRKLRWRSKQSNKGKSGGLRIIYFVHKDLLIILLTAYSKSSQDELSNEDRTRIQKTLRRMIEELGK